jgi:hypothetical protein
MLPLALSSPSSLGAARCDGSLSVDDDFVDGVGDGSSGDLVGGSSIVVVIDVVVDVFEAFTIVSTSEKEEEVVPAAAASFHGLLAMALETASCN